MRLALHRLPFWAYWRLRDLAFPVYDCEDCIGMIEHGCHCAYHGAPAPGRGPERWRSWLQSLLTAPTDRGSLKADGFEGRH